MHELKIKQLQYECNGWKRLLGFIMEENIHQKNRLSEVLSNGFDKSSLNDLEDFQTSFIMEDKLVGAMENEVKAVEKLLIGEVSEDGKITKNAENYINILKSKIKTIQTKFNRLKKEFDNYLEKI